MIVTNKKTGQDVTGLYIKLLSGEITKEEFENLAGLNNDTQDSK